MDTINKNNNNNNSFYNNTKFKFNNKQLKSYSSEEYHDKYINEYKVHPCKLLNCVRDRDCFFYHKKDEIRRAPFNNDNKLLYSHNLCPNIINCNDENCGFSHNDLEVMYHPYVFKTKMCHNFTATRSCKKSWCSYAHLESEKRIVEKNKPKKFNFTSLNNNNSRNNNNNISNDGFKGFNLNQSPTTSSSSSSSSPASSVNSQILSFNNSNGGNNVYYNDHYSSVEVNSSPKNKLVGTIKIKKSDPFNSTFIISDSSNSNNNNNSGQLHISGYYNRNRSFHNDTVVVEIITTSNNNNSIVPSQEELLFEKIFKDTIKQPVPIISTTTTATTQNNNNNNNNNSQPLQIESIKSNDHLIECKVVSIIKSQHQEIYCCKFLKKKDQFLLFEPLNCKIACIMVSVNQQQYSLPVPNSNELYEIKIDQPWSKNTLFPIGIILNSFSTENEFKRSIETLKIENGYSNNALNPTSSNNNSNGGLSINLIESLNAICLENNNNNQPSNNNDNYEDLTNLFSFSIQLDQENCDNEISNTFSFSKNEKTGEIRVYVHFVDCTNLIKTGSKLDRLASSIGTKINFSNIDRVNMIDQEFILENLSLLPGGSKRKCFTVEWSYTANKSVSTRVYKSIVKSSFHLNSVQEALNVLNNNKQHDDGDTGNNNGLIMEESIFKQLKLNLQILKSDILCKNSIYSMNNSKSIFRYSGGTGNIGKPIGIEIENLELINILNSIDEIKMLANYVTTYTLVDLKISGLIYKVSNSNIESTLFQEQNLFNLVPIIENNCKEPSLILHFILNQIQQLESFSSVPNQFHKFPFYAEFLNPLSNYTALYNQRILNIKFNNNGGGNGSIDNSGIGANNIINGLVGLNLIETVVSNCNLKFERSKQVLKKFTKLSFKSILESKPSIVLSALVVGITKECIQVWCKEYCKLFTIDIPKLNDGELLINLNDSEFIYNQDHSIQTKLLNTIKIQISKSQHGFQLSFLNSIQSSPSYNCNHIHNQDIFLKQPIQDLKTTNGNLSKFDSFNQYIDFQISLIDLNSIYKSISSKSNNNGGSIYFSNVSISFSKKKKKYLGTIEIPLNKLPLGFNKFAKGDFICCNFPGNDKNQPFGIHSIISKVDYAIKTPNVITIKFQVKIEKIPQRFPFFIEIIYRDLFNRDLLIGAQLFSEINHSTKQPSPIQSLISTGAIDSNIAFSSSSFQQLPNDCFLNSSQEMALQSSLNNSITIIEGESGCGKTLLTFLICKFAITDLQLTKQVLITGPNEESLDASCKSFLDFNSNFKMVRFNSITKQVFNVESSSSTLHSSTTTNSIENSKILLNESNIIFCTTIGSINSIIRDLNIKWVIIDNCHQEIEPKSLCAISCQTEHLILLGDTISDISVGPISVKSKKFRNLMKIPLSKRLSNFIKPFTLSTRYAPNIFNSLLSMDKINVQEIQNHNNFYNQKAYYSFFNLESIENIDYDIGNLNNCKQLDEKEMIQKFTNHQQVEFIIKFVEYLTVKQKVDPLEIVIVSPFESQRELIKKSINDIGIVGSHAINVLSIEQSQYYHFNYVIYSLVRTEGNASKSYWIESDQRTIKKMALIPKKGLFFVGSSNYFQKRERWNHLINHTRKLDSFVNVPLFGSFCFFLSEMKTHNSIKIKV